MPIDSYKAAIDYLYSLIPNKKKFKYPGHLGLKRTKHLLSLLGNPHQQFVSIHVTGTSGKGSVCYLSSLVLTTAGYKTGLVLSPHLTDIRERMQINNKLITRKEFISLVNKLKPYITKMGKSQYGEPTYFEVLVVMAFWLFAQKKVKIAVVETGMGGKYDATNVLSSALSIITNVGLDHTHILGDTVEQIIMDKREIIKPNSICISGASQKNVQNIIKRKCNQQQSKLLLLGREIKYKIHRMNKQGSVFSLHTPNTSYSRLQLSLVGGFQVINASLAIACINELNKKGIKVASIDIKKALQKAYFPGRIEVVKKRSLVILDGAHNVDKIKALVKTYHRIFNGQKIWLVVAIKKDKNITSMLKILTKISDTIVITQFASQTDFGKNYSTSINKLVHKAKKIKGYQNIFQFASAVRAIQYVLTNAKSNEHILITGSLYLVGEIKPFLLNLK
jgi:dihydrofolate synthase/folylpolyglutamate synthase